MTTVITLKAEHAEDIQALADRHYPSAYRMSVEDIAENLEGLEEEDCNFCFGVELDGHLAGYLMAWVDNSLIEGRVEDVVLVDDICIAPEARGCLYDLLRGMVRAMEEAGFESIPIEGTVRKDAEQTFVSHPDVIDRLGYQMAGSHEYSDELLDERMVWVRFESVDLESTIPEEDLCEVRLPEAGAS